MEAYLIVLGVAAATGIILQLNKMPYTVAAVILSLVTGVIGVNVAKHQHNSDTQLLAGRVAVKNVDTSSCRHSHNCRCVRDKDGRETCDTCYDHTFDYTYYVRLKGVDETVSQECGDCPPPSWWQRTNVGDAAAVPVSYQNFLLADDKNLLVPPQPAGVTGSMVSRDRLVTVEDRIHPKPVIAVDGTIAVAGLDDAVAEWNADHGSAKQTYLSIVLTRNPDPEYATWLAHTWKLGPKNSLVFILSINEGAIVWADVVTLAEDIELRRWTTHELDGVRIEDAFPLISEKVLKLHERTPMATLKYLEKSTSLGFGYLMMIALAQLLSTAIVAIVTEAFNNRQRQW